MATLLTRPRAELAIAVFFCIWSLAREARADVTAPSPAAIEAGKHFAAGADAFRRGDYATAGREFDAAYALAPHPNPIWNAAQAWERMQDLARAANRYSVYLDVAPEGAADREGAVTALARLSPKLARLSIHVRGDADSGVQVDGKPANVGIFFVYPGAHEVTAHVGTRTSRKNVDIRAGMVESVIFTDEAASPPDAAAGVPTERKLRVELPPERPSSGGLPAWTVWLGGGATLACLGVTIASGVDTLSARDQFVSHPSEEALRTGHSRQTRTNLLVGVTAGLAAATLAAALFVRWR